MTLWLKELKITFCSLSFWITIAIIAIFTFGNLGNLTVISEPTPNEDYHGFVIMANPSEQAIMTQTYGRLLSEFSQDRFVTFPLGVSRIVQPTESEWKILENIIESAYGQEITVLVEELNQLADENGGWIPQVIEIPLIEMPTYAQFESDMEQVTSILGKGSNFESSSFLDNIMEPVTYEQARREFELLVEVDQVSGAYVRYLNDYLGIILGLIPVFLSASIMNRDKISKSQDVLFSKSVSSFKLILSRYVSTIVLLYGGLLIISLMPALQSLFIARSLGVNGNLFLFYQYLTLWTLPSILAVVGLGFLITELFGAIVAIMMQLVLWLFFIVSNGLNLVGSVGWNLIPRFNTLGARELFDNIFNELLINRGVWSIIGIGCCLLTILVVDNKRKGGRAFGKGY